MTVAARQLVLIRHAKAEASGASDEERRLSTRGEGDARQIGRLLDEQGLSPDRVVLSPARRARQTWKLAATSVVDAPSPVIDDRIYVNTVDSLLEVIRATPAEIQTLVVVGHNPAFGSLASAFDRALLAQDFPTSGVAVVSVNGDWASLVPDNATLTFFKAPRG